MKDNKKYHPKPVACKVEIQYDTHKEVSFMPHERFKQYLSSGNNFMSIFEQARSEVYYIDYWDTNDLEKMVQHRVNSNGDFPEHCYDYRCVGTIDNKQIILAYIYNATIPYVRIDNLVTKGQESLFKYYGGDSMTKHLSSFPIVGYGFPAYLAIHSLIGSMMLYQGSNATNIHNLCEHYFNDRCDLYRAIHSKDYEWIESNLDKGNFERIRIKAQIKKTELYKTFLQHLLEQEKDNYEKNSTELLSLFNGRLNENVECFFDYVQEKLTELEPKPVPQVTKVEDDRQKPTPDFKTIIQPINGKSVEDILKRLHQLIDGKSGADVGVVILAARKQKILTKNPTEIMMKNEFGDIGKWRSVRQYFNENYGKAAVRADEIVFF